MYFKEIPSFSVILRGLMPRRISPLPVILSRRRRISKRKGEILRHFVPQNDRNRVRLTEKKFRMTEKKVRLKNNIRLTNKEKYDKAERKLRNEEKRDS